MKNEWPTNHIQKLLGIKHPIIQAPMANFNDSSMAIAVAKAGGLGSLPCATLSLEKIKSEVEKFRENVNAPINLNFFCHKNPIPNPEREIIWKNELVKYYTEFGIDLNATAASVNRKPFDEKVCELMLELKPEIISFHFGLPADDLVSKLKSAGIKILSSATTLEEALYLEAHSCDAVIAQGFEAGGHRAMFLNDEIASQVGTFALIPQLADALKIPIIASGGIGDARGIAAAFILGASAVQIGTAYLFTHEAIISPAHLKTLKNFNHHTTALTNLFSGKPARGIVNRLMRELGPMSDIAPEFPMAGTVLAPLKAKTEPQGLGDFISMWSGQAANLGRVFSAEELTKKFAEETLKKF